MKYSNLKDFEKSLTEITFNKHAPNYLILAKDAFDRKNAVDLLLKRLLNKKENPDLSLKVFEGESLHSEELLSELNTYSFFSKHQILIVNNADKLTKQVLKQLERYFEKPNPQLCLVLTAASISQSTNFYKKAEAAGIVLEIPEEKPWEKEKSMIEWVLRKVAEAAKKIDRQACESLVKQIGPNPAILEQELQKLFCYIDERKEITLGDIAAICTNLNVETSWQLGEAIFRKDSKTALRISKALLTDGVAFIILLRQIRSQFQTEFQICSILTMGGSKQDITKKFPYMKGQILDRHVQMAQSYGLNQFKLAMQTIDDAEVMAKNSVSDLEFLTELLIIKLTT